MRAPLGLATLVAVVGMSTACAPGGGDPQPSASFTPVAVRLMDFMLAPTDLTVEGPSVEFAVANDGPTPHNFSIRDADGEIVLGTTDLRPGASTTLSGELEPGTYDTLCALPGHESLGMRGTLTVTGP